MRFFKTILVFSFIFALVACSLWIFEFTRVNSISSSNFQISQSINGNWKKLYSQSFGVKYETKSFELTPQNGQVKVQINQTTLPFADIEFVHLNACGVDINPEYAKYVLTGVSVLADISADDNNVIVNHEKPIEILWNTPKGCSGIVTMTMKANEYTSSEANAVRFPYDGVNDQSYIFRNNKSIKVDGTLSQVDGLVKPTYSALWHSNTGHPDGYTYIYMNDDAKNVYLSYDITGDNTNEHGPDWLKIIILNTKDGKQKTYKINDDPSQYGQCGFGLTSKVSYKHATCDVEIPKSDLVGNQLDFYSLYYGTFSGPQFQYLGVSSSPSNTLPVIKGLAVDNGGSGATISSVKFGIRDRDTNPDPGTDLQYDGTCTADDGTFDSSSENFTCTATESLSYGVNYAVDLELFENDNDTPSDIPNGNGQINFTLYNNDYSIVHTFASGDVNNGTTPIGQFVKSGDLLYGATAPDYVGEGDGGVIYSIHPDGSDMTVLHTFSLESEYSVSGALVASGSVLYGIVQYGGDNNHGGVFKINMDGSGYSLIYSFHVDNGYDSQGSLIIVGGRLYGLNQWGGDNNSGTIFGLDLDGNNFKVLHSFSDPNAPNNKGNQPMGSLVESGGVLFGTTYEGGDNNAGTIFSINSDGTNFQYYSLTGEDASGPTGSLTLIGNDLLFGSNQYGGSGSGGDIFKISKSLTGYSVIHTFANNMNDGGATSLLALQLWNNKLYGDTWSGGDNGKGTLFSMNLDGSDYSLLHEFNGAPYDGATLNASPLIDEGIMYGVTYYGGTNNYGTMFTMTVGGSNETPTCSSISNAATYNAYPTCGAASCNSGYELSGGSCVAGTCPTISNAATYNAYPTCGVATCQTGYALTNGNCVASGGGGGSIPPQWLQPPTAPVGGFNILINNGATSTANPAVTLNLQAGSDTARMALSNFSDFRDAGQENYAQSKIWNLCWTSSMLQNLSTCPAGTYNVYAKFYTQYGQSSAPISASIVLRNNSLDGPTQTTSGFTFIKRLQLGMNMMDVKYLQIILNSDKDTQIAISGVGSFGHETTKFGFATYNAVKRFQKKYANEILVPQGFKSPTGIVGLYTNKKLNSMLSVLGQ